MTSPTVEVVPIGRDRLREVAAVHLRAFPRSVLTGLGPEAVRRYYEWQLCGPHDVVFLGAVTGSSEVIGFCVGGVFRGALSGFVRANVGFLMRTVVARPSLWPRAVGQDRGRLCRFALVVARARRSPGPRTLATSATFGVLALAVDPVYCRVGVGRALMAVAEQAARQGRFVRMALTVDPANVVAISFYEAAGWTRSDGTMEKDLPPNGRE